MDYFKTQKNATQRDISLFNIAISKNDKKKIKQKHIEQQKLEKLEEKKLEKLEENKMTDQEKQFIMDQYMYESDGEDEDMNEKVAEEAAKEIIDF